MKVIGVVLAGYFGIGVAVLAVQLATRAFIPPSCDGLLTYSLTERYFPPFDMTRELEKTRTGEKDVRDVSIVLRVGLHALRWAPDVSARVMNGDMTIGNYLRGGAECHRYPAR